MLTHPDLNCDADIAGIGVLAKTTQSTGVLEGGIVSHVPLTTSLSWTAGVGQVANYTNPANPVVTRVTWEAVSTTIALDDGQYVISYTADGQVSLNAVSLAADDEYITENISIGSFTVVGGIIPLSYSTGNIGYNGGHSFKSD